MNYNQTKLNRHQNAAFSQHIENTKGGKTANFAPLWQLAGGAGALAGGVKGGLDQNEDGTQMDAGQRLMNVGMNAAAGGTLLGAAGAGIPQIFNENPDQLYKAQQVYDATGVNVAPPGKVPVGKAARVRAERVRAVREGRTLPQRIKRAVDPVTGTLEIGAEDVNNYVVNPVKRVTSAVYNAGKAAKAAITSPEDKAIQEQRRLIEETNKRAVAQEVARMQEEATRQLVTSPENIERNKKAAEKVVTKTTDALLDDPLTPNQQLVRKAQNAILEAKVRGKQASIDAGNTFRRVRMALGFSYMSDTANFGEEADTMREIEKFQARQKLKEYGQNIQNAASNLNNKILQKPYATGLMGGALLGTGVGAGIGLGNSMNNAAKQEANQLSNIQAISDPYARKKEWDVYDDDLSRTGRNIGYTTQGLGTTALGAGIGAGAGGVLGGALLSGYKNVKEGNYNLAGSPQATPKAINRALLRGVALGGLGTAGLVESSHLINGMLGN